jgi:hypothetical protein
MCSYALDQKKPNDAAKNSWRSGALVTRSTRRVSASLE